MRLKLLTRLVTLFLILALLVSDIPPALPGSGVDSVKAASPFLNALVGFIRVGGTLKKRTAVYTEAGVTTSDINAYYDSLIEQAQTARQGIFTRAAAGERLTLARSYIRIEAALEAERKAAISMIEAEKNQARKDFERTLGKFIANILIASPGGQKIISQVRQAIRGACEAAVAVQAALEGGKPIEALGDALGRKVGDIRAVQELARGLGSAVGHKIDRALGGAGGRIEGMIGSMQAGLGDGIDLLDNLDAEVAVHDNRQRQPVSLVEDPSMIKEVFTVDRSNPVADVVASAFAGGAAVNGSLEPGITRGAMRDRIRDALLDGRITRIQSIAARSGVGSTYCAAVGRGEYESAAQQLSQAVLQAKDPQQAAYLVCYDNQTGLPVYTRLIEEEEGESTQEAPLAAGEIPAGTYIGTGDWFSKKRKTVTESMTSEIIITVNKDGSVTGSLSAHMIEITTHNDVENCSAHWEHIGSGTFSGQLTGPSGVIENTETWTWNVYTDCPDRGTPVTLTFPQLIDVEVAGDLITGTTRSDPDDPDGLWMYTLTAKKQ